MKKRILLGGFLLMVAVSFVACGSKSNSSESNYEELQDNIANLQSQLKEVHSYKEENDVLTKLLEELTEKVERLQESQANSTKPMSDSNSTSASQSAQSSPTSASSSESETNSGSSSQKSEEVPNDNLADLLFWEADAPYEMRDKNFKFYCDKSCDDEFLIEEQLTFTNYFDYEIIVVDSDGKMHNIYISMSHEKGLVFSKERPYFNKIE